MTAYNCNHCGNTVDEKAKICPRCNKDPSEKKKGMPLLFKLIIGAGLIYISPYVYQIFIRSDESKIASYTEELSTISKGKYKRIYYLSEGLFKLSKENKKELTEKYKIAKKEYTNDLLVIVENREELEAYKELTYLYPDNKKYSDKVIEIEQKEKNAEEAEIAKKNLKFNTIYSAKKLLN